MDVVKASTDDLGPLSIDFFRKNNMSASWKFFELETTTYNNVTFAEVRMNINMLLLLLFCSRRTCYHLKDAYAFFLLFFYVSRLDWLQIQGKKHLQEHTSNEDHSRPMETLAILVRRQLREKSREKHAADLVKQDDDVTVKLETAAMEHSNSVDSAVLGKHSIWRKENENENSDSNVRLIRDQMIMARLYISLARMMNKTDLANELQNRLKDSQRSSGDATADSELQRSAPEKIKVMDQVLANASEQLYDCKLVTGKLRAMLQSADEQVRILKKQSTFLSHIAAKTIPNGLNCLSMILTIDYYLLPQEKRKFPHSENLENPSLYHYALFSDNVLGVSVVVNSTIMDAKEPEKLPSMLKM